MTRRPRAIIESLRYLAPDLWVACRLMGSMHAGRLVDSQMQLSFEMNAKMAANCISSSLPNDCCVPRVKFGEAPF